MTDYRAWPRFRDQTVRAPVSSSEKLSESLTEGATESDVVLFFCRLSEPTRESEVYCQVLDLEKICPSTIVSTIVNAGSVSYRVLLYFVQFRVV